MVKRRKKLKTRLTAVLLTLGMVASSVATNLPSRVFGVPDEAREVYAETNTWTDTNGVKFTYEDLAEGGVIINRIDSADGTSPENGRLSLVIPDKIEGKPVKELLSNTIIYNQNAIGSIKIESTSLETIPYPFAMDCNLVASVTFAEGCQVKTIGDYAFKGCKNLETITLPNSVETIGKSAFSGCSGLTSINLGNSLKTIGESAFSGTKLTTVTIPDSLTTIGDKVFYLVNTLTTVTINADSSNLTSIGNSAFYGCTGITALTFPDSLTTIGEMAFMNCGAVQTIRWPQDNPQFTTIPAECFEGCTGLENSALTGLPSSVTDIKYRAFYRTKFTEVVIPWSVIYVGKEAFAENQNDYSYSVNVTITIEESSKALTIDEKAFYLTSRKDSTKVILPERVKEIGDEAFGFGLTNLNEFTIYNKNIVINGNPWGDIRWATIKYPSDMTTETSPSFMSYMQGKIDDSGEYPFTFTPFDLVATYTVSGIVPNGAVVTAMVGGDEVDPEMTASAFSFDVLENSLVTVIVSLEGYKDKLYTKKASEFTENWDLGNITTADLTPIDQIGSLSIITEGTGGVEANVSVFNSTGELVASDAVDSSGAFLVQDIAAGEYTVVAIEKNAYISGISSLDSLDTLGIDATNYAKGTATVIAGDTAEITLDVPAMPQVKYSNIVDEIGSFVAIDRTLVTRNLEFYGKVFYRMQGNNKASEVKIVVPDGLEVVSVTAGNKNKNVASVYSNGVITIDGLTGDDAESGTIYVGLRSPQTGAFCISASVKSTSGITVPVGSVDYSVKDIVLDVKESIVASRIIPVIVWSEPNKQVTVRAGTGDEIIGKTNQLGYFSGNVELPANAPSGTSHVIIATVDGSAGTYKATNTVFYEGTKTEVDNFYFVHGNRKYNIVLNGVDKSGGFYTYVADGREETKTWVFAADLVSSSALTGDVTVGVQMMDGSVRNVTLSPISNEVLPDGRVKTSFSANMYIDTPGYHIFEDSLVPEGFDLDYVSDENYPFVTDAAYTEYVNELIKMAKEERKEDVDNIIDTTWTEEECIRFYNEFLVGGGYHYSERAEYEEYIRSLSTEYQDALIKVEQALDDVFDAWAIAMGDKKPMYEYNTLGEYIQDNWWKYEVYEGKTLSDFVDEGFILSDDGSFAYSEDGLKLVRVIDDKENNKEGIINSNKRSKDDDRDVVIEFVEFVKDGVSTLTSKDYRELYWNVFKTSLSTAQAYVALFKEVAEKQLMPSHFPKEIATIGTYAERCLGAVGFVAGCYDAYKGSEDYLKGVQQTDRFTTDYINISNEVRQAAKLGKYRTPECLEALRNEENAAYELSRVSEKRDYRVQAAVVAGAIMTIVGGALLFPAIAGAVGIASLGLAGSFGLGLVTGGVDFLCYNVTAKHNNIVANSKADADRARLERKYKCNSKYKSNYKLNVIFDPSGYVYEAVESNRVEGATATVIYAQSEAAWDATEYNQINPQTTDKDGTFAWDVPQGTYKVKVEKEGYETAYTDALEVPPPRMDVRIPLVTKKAPEVESLNAYTDYIEVIFTQYMKIDDKSEIVATVNGKSVASSSFEWQDAEESPSGEKYAKVVRIPVPAGTKVGDTLDVQISKAKNYAGIPMSAAYSEKAKVTHRPTEIILNYETVLTMQAGNDKNITVRIKDENGDYMEGVSISALIENTYLAELAESTLVTDEEGKVVFKASALLPGLTNATFKVDGTTLKTNIKVQIETEAVRPKRPTASIAGIEFSEGAPKENYLTVAAGSTLTLECATEGATIYYTLDDTCPCQNSASRIEYTGPITITEDCRIRIAAYKDGLEYSERLNLNITVKQPDEFVISYDLNGGTLNGKTGIITEKHKEGEEITIPDAPTREGYKFDYWEGSKHYPGDKYVIVGDHTFKAVWIALDEDEQDDQEVEDKDSPSGDKSSDNEASNDSNGSGAKDATIDVPDNSRSAENDVAAKTGDPFDPVLWTVSMLTAFAGWLAVIMLKKKRK